MKRLIFILISAIVFSGCNRSVQTEVVEVEALRASDIYYGRTVYEYIDKFKNSNAAIAESYIAKGENARKSNPEKAVYFFKRAITLHPTLDAYKELAKQLMVLGKYEELHRLYSFLVYKTYADVSGKYTGFFLFGEPDEDVIYEQIVTGILDDKKLWAEDIYWLRELNADVERIKSRLLADERLKIDTTSEDGKRLMMQFLPDEELKAYAYKPNVFNDFLNSIKDSSATFAIDQNSVHKFKYENFNGINGSGEVVEVDFNSIYIHYLQEFQDKSDAWLKFNFNHIIRLNNDVTAVVYAIDSSAQACSKEMRHIYHRVVSFDNRTLKIIDSKVIAAQAGEILQTASFDGRKIYVTSYKRTWKKPYNIWDFDNFITDTKAINEVRYEILDNGTIKEVEVAESI